MTYDFTNPAGLDQAECEWLTAFCRRNNIKTALEFGPGNSTVAMLEGGVTLVETFEQDIRLVRQLRVDVIDDIRIVVHVFRATEFPIYPDFHGHNFGLAFIDGPTGDVMNPARLNACLFALRKAPLMLIHDSKRDRQTISILEQLGCVKSDRFDSERGILVLRAPQITPRP